VQGQLARSLKLRDPLIQWHLKTLDPQQPQGAFDECVLVHGRESCAARYAELREALRSVIPCFVALISEAARRRPPPPLAPKVRDADLLPRNHQRARRRVPRRRRGAEGAAGGWGRRTGPTPLNRRPGESFIVESAADGRRCPAGMHV